ncbi:site-2 protease family protein [Salinactinospora qingdaonensis]|uniref:Zinc metalloprotease n=1 Tax=Salinactinospora qingdaonensis TaxID=702744 RepID=A0ABP7EXF5_9ACTN
MQETFSLGRVAGIRVGLNWSVLVIFAIIVFGLAEGRLPSVYPDRPAWLYWGVGIATAVVFFASLLAHELAHAIVARRNGVVVDGITLWLLGGVARMRDEAPTPGAELRIAGVGPAVSFLLGMLFAVVAWLLSLVSAVGLDVEAVAWLAAINVVVAVFNVIPAAPLDGGRLLRALLWWRTGDRVRAAVGATTAGRFLGWFLVLLGLYVFLRGATLSGIWIALIGSFLIAVATSEGRQVQVRNMLAGVTVREAMTPDPVMAPAGTTIADFLYGPLFRYRHSAFPVTEDGTTAVGLVTVAQIQDVAVANRSSTTVADVMLPLDDSITVSPDEPLADLLDRLEPSPDQRWLVIDDGRLVGIVTPSDVSRAVTWLTSLTSRAGRRDG